MLLRCICGTATICDSATPSPDQRLNGAALIQIMQGLMDSTMRTKIFEPLFRGTSAAKGRLNLPLYRLVARKLETSTASPNGNSCNITIRRRLARMECSNDATGTLCNHLDNRHETANANLDCTDEFRLGMIAPFPFSIDLQFNQLALKQTGGSISIDRFSIIMTNAQRFRWMFLDQPSF